MADFDPILPTEIPQQRIPSAAVVDTSAGDAVNFLGGVGMEVFKGAVKEKTRRELADEEAQIAAQVEADQQILDEAGDRRVEELLERAGPDAAALMEQNPTLLEFERELAKNNAAVEQGIMDSATADMRMEARARTMLNRFPGLAPSIREVAARHASGGRALTVQSKLARIDQRKKERVTAEELRDEQLQSATKYGFTASEFQTNPVGVMGAVNRLAALERQTKEQERVLRSMNAIEGQNKVAARKIAAQSANGYLAASQGIVSQMIGDVNKSPGEWQNFLNSGEAQARRTAIQDARAARQAALRAPYIEAGMDVTEIDKILAPALAPFDTALEAIDGKKRLEAIQTADTIRKHALMAEFRSTQAGSVMERMGVMLDFLPEEAQRNWITQNDVAAKSAPLYVEGMNWAQGAAPTLGVTRNLEQAADAAGVTTKEMYGELLEQTDTLLQSGQAGLPDEQFLDTTANLFSSFVNAPNMDNDDVLATAAKIADPRFLNRFEKFATSGDPRALAILNYVGAASGELTNRLSQSMALHLNESMAEVSKKTVTTGFRAVPFTAGFPGVTIPPMPVETKVSAFVEGVGVTPRGVKLRTGERFDNLDPRNREIVNRHLRAIERTYQKAFQDAVTTTAIAGNETPENAAAILAGLIENSLAGQ